MPLVSPLLPLERQADAFISPWGPPIGETSVEIVQSFGELELEYAAIRKSCALIDQPQRGTIQVAGGERLEFLNRMLTQELKGMPAMTARRSFWLNRKGRIDADVLVVNLGDRLILDLDVHALGRSLQGLNAYIIADDVTLADITDATARLALHGPTSATILDEVAESPGPERPLGTLAIGEVSTIVVAGSSVIVVRNDFAGVPGFELFIPAAGVTAVFQRLLAIATPTGLPESDPRHAIGHRVRLRPAGWAALNMARIEAGSPVYNIDFDESSLPAESGVLHDRVSFTKGCYLGQEIVARMHARGHPKAQLVALKPKFPVGAELRDMETQLAFQPVGASPVFKSPQADVSMEAWQPLPEAQVGTITSSTLAPMLSSTPVCFASVKYDLSQPGTELVAIAEGQGLLMTVQPQLRFLEAKP